MDGRGQSTYAVVKELHSDLASKYRKHAKTLEKNWTSFDQKQRARCMRAGAADGVVLKHRLDRSMGNVYKVMPEWNLAEITEPGSNTLLDLLKNRATKTLLEQYSDTVDECGDCSFIEEMMRTKGLQHVDSFKNCYTLFLDEKEYGHSFKITSDIHREEVLGAFAPALRSGHVVPQSTGELILQRQMYLLQTLNIMIEDILEEGSKTRSQKERPKKTEEAVSAAFSKLTVYSPPKKPTLPYLAKSSSDQKEALKEYLDLLSMEPVVLAHAVNIWFFSRPEMVADAQGRCLPVHTDKYISTAVFDAIHSSIQATAIWDYIERLLHLLLETAPKDKVSRAITLQEVSNICHFEYGRAQSLFKRHVQSHSGAKWFKRVSNASDNAGNARVTMKGDPAELTLINPSLHYVLRLCQPEMSAPKAVEWMQRLGQLHQSHPLEREKLNDREVDSLCDLAVIIGFVQDLSAATSMPSFSRKKGQAFISRSQELEVELNQLKQDLDLRDFAVPIDNLLEPGMTEGALKVLDQFVVERAGTKMGFLYQDLVEECISDVQARCRQAKEKVGANASSPELSPFHASAGQPLKQRVEQRKQKEKTRPAHPSTYEITQPSEMPDKDVQETIAAAHPLIVASSTAEAFSALFAKSQARGSVAWTAFENAMAELGFSVMPKFGSVYTFLPPAHMNLNNSFTVHRPHQSRIEGYKIPIFARRLSRLYGWGENTFVAA